MADFWLAVIFGSASDREPAKCLGLYLEKDDAVQVLLDQNSLSIKDEDPFSVTIWYEKYDQVISQAMRLTLNKPDYIEM